MEKRIEEPGDGNYRVVRFGKGGVHDAAQSDDALAHLQVYEPTETAVEQEDEIAAEYPLTIRLDGEEFATIVCSPSHLEEMTTGFLASEGIIRQAEEIQSLRLDEERGFVYVELHIKQSTSKHDYAKRMIGSCCGKSRQFYFQNDARTARTSTSSVRITPSQCVHLIEQLQQGSEEFRRTGGFHNAALCSATELLAVRSDIGRHNALDKLFGYRLQHKAAHNG